MSSPSDVANAWDRVERCLDRRLPALCADLAPGAAQEALDAIAERTGLPLPDDLRALYAHHDGQRSPTPGLFFGLRFLTVSEAGDEWGRWTSLIDDDPSLANDVTVWTHPSGAVREVYASAGWLPFASDGAGNHLAIDLDPGPDGTEGQVISFGADEPARYALAPSAAHFLDWFAHTCETEAFVVPDPNATGGQALLLPGGISLLDAVPARFGPLPT